MGIYAPDVQKVLEQEFPEFEVRVWVVNEYVFAIQIHEKGDPAAIVYNYLHDVCNPLGVVVSGNLYIDKRYQGQGIGQRLMRAKQNLGYSLMCHIHPDNEAQKHILTKTGWQDKGDGFWYWKNDKE